MKLPILELNYRDLSDKDFILFWSAYYIISKNDHLYTVRINNKRFTKSDIEKLFEWKNGMKVNGHIPKQASINKVISRLKYVNELKTNFNLIYFQLHFSDIAAIWQIFLLHIIQPKKFPIFDQHVYRAHIFLKHKIIQEIPNHQPSKLKYYHNEYIPFVQKLKREVKGLRKIDMAVWAFGKFLKTQYAKKIINP